MSRTLFHNARLVFPDYVTQGFLTVEDGKIAGIYENEPDEMFLGHYENIVDCGGNFLSPGFIDIHTHGAGGHDFVDGTEEAVIGACLEHLRHGTTSIVPTAMACTNEELAGFFQSYRAVKKSNFDGPNLLGVHLEGPFFNPVQAGAQPPEVLKIPSPDQYLPILDAGGDEIRRMSVAVELEGAMALGDELTRRGIVAAIGHSDASLDQVREAMQHGYSHLTHFYSCMSTVHRVGPYRILGIIEAGYLYDDLTIEIIADGKHLPAELLQMIVKCKDNEKISLITDSMRCAGMGDGATGRLGSKETGTEAIVSDGVAMMPDRKAFAGSVCTTDRCVRTMHKLAGVPIEKAVQMMTLNPAKLMGVHNAKGSLERGKDADFVIFDDDVDVKAVYVSGRRLA